MKAKRLNGGDLLVPSSDRTQDGDGSIIERFRILRPGSKEFDSWDDDAIPADAKAEEIATQLRAGVTSRA